MISVSKDLRPFWWCDDIVVLPLLEISRRRRR